MQQSRRRFRDRVRFITAPGNRVRTLVSTMGVFEKPEDQSEFILTRYFADRGSRSREEIIRDIKENCGWDLRVAPDPREIAPPTSEELRLLRIFDPRRFYLK